MASFAISSLALLISGCATPNQVAQMSPEELRGGSDRLICETYAVFHHKKTDAPNISAEVKRRRLDCSLEIEIQGRINDCSSVKIVAIKQSPVYSNVTDVTVRNISKRAKSFRIHDDLGIYGKTNRLAPNTIDTFAIATEEKTRRSAAVTALVGGNSLAEKADWGVFECYTVRW